jgi:arylformamidase
MTGTAGMISVDDLKPLKIRKGERILVKTRNSAVGFDRFRNDYVYLAGNAAAYLATKDISLFGIDYISVKQRGGKDNRAHTALLEKGIVILEGLDLSNVLPGRYNLIALPLGFTGLDGAPARAVLTS